MSDEAKRNMRLGTFAAVGAFAFALIGGFASAALATGKASERLDSHRERLELLEAGQSELRKDWYREVKGISDRLSRIEGKLGQ